MTRGGFRANNKVESNHFFKPKWRLGKTAAIRIPAILKNRLMEVAKYLDNKSENEIKSLDIIESLKTNSELNKRTFNLHNETVRLNREIDMLIHINEDLRKQLENIAEGKCYQIAEECFTEYVNSQGVNLEDLSKSRKGTKKRQLWDISQWLKSKSTSETS